MSDFKLRKVTWAIEQVMCIKKLNFYKFRVKLTHFLGSHSLLMVGFQN